MVTSTHVCMHSRMYVRMCLRSYSPGFLYKSLMAVKKTIVIEGIDFGLTSVLIKDLQLTFQ